MSHKSFIKKINLTIIAVIVSMAVLAGCSATDETKTAEKTAAVKEDAAAQLTSDHGVKDDGSASDPASPKSDIPYAEENMPLCIEAKEDGVVVRFDVKGTNAGASESGKWEGKYSIDGRKWKEYTTEAPEDIELNAGDHLFFIGKFAEYGSKNKYPHIGIDGLSGCNGNIMSIVAGDNFADVRDLPKGCSLYGLFYGNEDMETAPELPATALTPHCYENMFESCYRLAKIPDLPATELAPYCYEEMFNHCYALTGEGIVLPATTLAEHCYEEMFMNCDDLETAPELPAATMEPYCYAGMFRECKDLQNIQILPAKSLAEHCYENMFYNCRYNMTETPELPAEKLAPYCYSHMFDSCLKLKDAKGLPATELADFCYEEMFSHCSDLETAPVLPAMQTATACYDSMFYDCSSLLKAPELPATSTSELCYCGMFEMCSALKETPELPATDLNTGCYAYMFKDCGELAKACCLPAENIGINSYREMFSGCKSLTEKPDLPGSVDKDRIYEQMGF